MEGSDSPSESTQTPRLYGSACDTCRRRRVKCDGKQPCGRCTKSGISCTYGSATNRASAISYARHLETKVAKLESILEQLQHSDVAQHETSVSLTRESRKEQTIEMLIGPGDDYISRISQTSANIFYGRFSGLGFLRSMGSSLIHDPSVPQLVLPGRALVEAFERETSLPLVEGKMRKHSTLPTKEQVQSFADKAVNTALICHDCLDYGRFPHQLNRLYEVDPEDYLREDEEFLTLVYALLALGKRSSPSDLSDDALRLQGRGLLKGSHYLAVSCDLLDLSDRHGLDSLRAIICQARFMLSASMISKAHSRVCIGVGAALRMGLHISCPALRVSFSSDELLQRRRVFATLNMMDTYLSSLLGTPKILKDIDIEQTLSLEDEDIVDEGQSFISQTPDSRLVATVMCQRLNNIMAKIAHSRFLLQIHQYYKTEGLYEEEIDLVAAREAEIREWHEELLALPHGVQSDMHGLQVQLTLLLWHSLAQVMLYRPFLHHLTRDPLDSKFNIRGYECGSYCVRAAMQAVWVVEAFQTHGILHEAYWLNMYMLSFAASILVFFVLSASQRTTLEESINAIRKAKMLLELLGKHNSFAEKCSESLAKVLSTAFFDLTEG